MYTCCCSEDPLYVALKMLGGASKNLYLRKMFRFFRTHIFSLSLFLVLIDFSESNIDCLLTSYIWIQFEHTLFFRISGAFHGRFRDVYRIFCCVAVLSMYQLNDASILF